MQQLLECSLDLVADQNGNHVVQKCIECIKPTSHVKPLIDVSPPSPPPYTTALRYDHCARNLGPRGSQLL